jgi:hypothetical protein
MVNASEAHRGIAARIWSVLTSLVAIVGGATVAFITNGPWWVGGLVAVATMALFWAIELAVGKMRR